MGKRYASKNRKKSSRPAGSTAKIHSDSTTKKGEMAGLFPGALSDCHGLFRGGRHLPDTKFYTDVLGLSGVFLTLMPLLSKAVDVIMNLLIGRLIDHTRTDREEARPCC